MKRSSPRKPSKAKLKSTRTAVAPKSMAAVAIKRASIFRNGSNQAVRLPQDLSFPKAVKEVRIRRQGDGLLLSPVRPDWASFFASSVTVPDDFMADRNDPPPQSREPL